MAKENSSKALLKVSKAILPKVILDGFETKHVTG